MRSRSFLLRILAPRVGLVRAHWQSGCPSARGEVSARLGELLALDGESAVPAPIPVLRLLADPSSALPLPPHGPCVPGRCRPAAGSPESS